MLGVEYRGLRTEVAVNGVVLHIMCYKVAN